MGQCHFTENNSSKFIWAWEIENTVKGSAVQYWDENKTVSHERSQRIAQPKFENTIGQQIWRVGLNVRTFLGKSQNYKIVPKN